MSRTSSIAIDSFQLLNPLERGDWNEAILGHERATIFHTAEWASVLWHSYGYTPVYLGSSSDGRLDALLPLMEVRSALTGRRGVSLPFSDECALLGAGAGEFKDLFEAALRLGRKSGWSYLELRGGIEAIPEACSSVEFFGHSLDLEMGEEALFQGLHSSVRRAIRKAESQQVTVEMADSADAMRAYYDLHVKTRKRHGLPPQPFRFFAEIQKRLLSKGLGFVLLARFQGRAIAGSVFLHFNRHAIYKFGASDERYQQFRANNLVMWEAIRWYARHGFATFDMGRTDLEHDGLRRFKLQFGTRERRVGYCKFDFRTGLFTEERLKVSGWQNVVFSRLPAPISRFAGSLLYRHIA